jgi:hypothetical protein
MRDGWDTRVVMAEKAKTEVDLLLGMTTRKATTKARAKALRLV